MILSQFFSILTFVFFSCGSDSNSHEEIVTFRKLPEIQDIQSSQKEYIRSKKQDIRRFSIAAVGEVRGEIEPCGCPTLPYGGFARRDMMLQQKQPSFHVDVGEMLLKGFSTTSHVNSQQRALEIASLSQKVGVDVWAVGPSDVVALGISTLQQIDAPVRISATYVDEQHNFLFDPFVVLQTKNQWDPDNTKMITVAFVGFSEKIDDPIVQKQVTYLDPVDAWNKIASQIPKDVDFIIGLTSITDQKLQKLEQEISKSSLAIPLFISTRGEAYEQVKYPSMEEYPNKATIIEVPDRGRYVENIIIQLGTDASKSPIFQGLEQKWRSLSEDVLTEEDRDLFFSWGEGFNLLFSESIALNKVFEPQSQTKIKEQLDVFRESQIKKAEEISKRKLEDFEVGYAAMGKCVRCHNQEMSKWSLTKHARAWETLIVRGEQDNPECIACHSTGYGQPGGFGELTETQIRKYKSVQCESCHGPMLSHPQNEQIKAQPIDKNLCLSCHDEANSPKFDFESYLRRATCQ